MSSPQLRIDHAPRPASSGNPATLYCQYCHALNDRSDARCVRCGRRLGDPAAQAAAPVAPAEDPQPLLFQNPNPRPKVVAIPNLVPPEPAAPRVNRTRATTRSRRKFVSDAQQELQFGEASLNLSLPNGSLPEEAIYCEAPVAHPGHRLTAAAIDAGLVLVGVGIFLSIFAVCGGELTFSRSTGLIVAGVVAVVSTLYRALWAVADIDTPGMRSVGLTLIDFDGREPQRDQRWVRQLAGALSFLSAGLGLLWALVDDESLTWHDHISKTFPTFRHMSR